MTPTTLITRGYTLVVDRVRKAAEQHAPHPATHDGKALRRVGNLLEGAVQLGKKVGRRAAGSGEVPLERLRNLGAGHGPDAERGLANPRAELVAEGGPRNASVGVRIRFRLAAVELGGEGGRDWRGGGRVETFPESADERDAFLGGEGFESLRAFDHAEGW